MSGMDRLADADLARAVDQAPDLVRIVAADGTVLYASGAARSLLDISPDDLVGRSMREFHHPDEEAALAQSGLEAVTQGTEVRRLHRHLLADGSYRWLETTARSTTLTGLPVLVLVSRDATAQVEAGAELTLQRRRMVELVTATHGAAVLVDDGLRTLAVSRGAARILMSSGAARLHLPLNELCGRAFGPDQAAVVVRAARTALSAKCEHVTSARECGAGRQWTVSCTPLPSVAGVRNAVFLCFEPADGAVIESSGAGAPPSSRPAPSAHLTPRERQVLDGLAHGLDARALAERLHLSEHTVRGHIKAVLQKLHAHTRLQAVLEGIRVGAVTGVLEDPTTDRPRVGSGGTPD
jgi:PAS domain S-box-containing protein